MIDPDCPCNGGECPDCLTRRAEKAEAEVTRMRALLDEVRSIVGTAVKCPDKLRPQAIWDLADWSKRAEATP